MNFSIVLNKPKYEGNVGSVARVMKNFGYSELILIDPCPLGEKANQMAVHAGDILQNAETFSCLDEVIESADLVIGTTGVLGNTDQKHLRVPILTPEELKDSLEGRGGRVLLFFGREDVGLRREELALCDIVVHIPTTLEYPIMNLSHSVCVMLYILHQKSDHGPLIDLAGKADVERLLVHLREVLIEAEYPTHKLQKTILMSRRIIGRSVLTKREVYTLRGVLRKIERMLGIRQ